LYIFQVTILDTLPKVVQLARSENFAGWQLSGPKQYFQNSVPNFLERKKTLKIVKTSYKIAKLSTVLTFYYVYTKIS